MCAGCGAAARHPGSVGCRFVTLRPSFFNFFDFRACKRRFCRWGGPFGARLFSFCACSSVSIFRKPKSLNSLRALAGSLRYLVRALLSSSVSWRVGFRGVPLRKSWLLSACPSFRWAVEELGVAPVPSVFFVVWTPNAALSDLNLTINQAGFGFGFPLQSPVLLLNGGSAPSPGYLCSVIRERWQDFDISAVVGLVSRW